MTLASFLKLMVHTLFIFINLALVVCVVGVLGL